MLTRLDRTEAQEWIATWSLRRHAAVRGATSPETTWLEVLDDLVAVTRPR